MIKYSSRLKTTPPHEKEKASKLINIKNHQSLILRRNFQWLNRTDPLLPKVLP